MSNKGRLSSDSLYHYTRTIEAVKGILQEGFRHTLCGETVMDGKSVQQNFIVCFCDILPDQASVHKQCYGNIAIVMTKSWGIEKGISPVRYVHKNSTGQHNEYNHLRNVNRIVREKNPFAEDTIQYAHEYLCYGMFLIKNNMIISNIEQSTCDYELKKFVNEFDRFQKSLSKAQGKIYFNYMFHIGLILHKLHNELEKRDSLVRAYQDNFKCPSSGETIKNKVLYDEREWRSVESIDSEHLRNHPNSYEKAIKDDKFLPKEFNLTFTNDDLVAILVDNETQLEKLTTFINNNNPLQGSCIDIKKLQLFQDFQDNPNIAK